GERVLPEVDHQQPADAVDEVGKVVAEIEAGTVGHEIEIPADSSRDAFFGRLARCQRSFGATQLFRLIRGPAGIVKLHLQQLQMHLYSPLTRSRAATPATNGRSAVDFGYFTLSDNHYENNTRGANQFVADIAEEALHADKLGMHSAWIGEHHFNS